MTPALVLVSPTPGTLMLAQACLGRVGHLIVAFVLGCALVVGCAEFFLLCFLHFSCLVGIMFECGSKSLKLESC